MFTVLYVNCFSGRFVPYWPFATTEEAERWITERPPLDHASYSVLPMFDPATMEPYTSPTDLANKIEAFAKRVVLNPDA